MVTAQIILRKISTKLAKKPLNEDHLSASPSPLMLVSDIFAGKYLPLYLIETDPLENALQVVKPQEKR